MPANELTMIEHVADALRTSKYAAQSTLAIAAAARSQTPGIVILAASEDDRGRILAAVRSLPAGGGCSVPLLTSWIGNSTGYDDRPMLVDNSAIIAMAEDAKRAREQYAAQAEILRCAKEEAASLRIQLNRALIDFEDASAARHAADIVIRDATAALDRCGVGHPPPGASGLELSNRIMALASHLPPPPRAEDLLDPWAIELHALKDQIRKRHFLNAHFRAFVLAQKTWDEHVRLSNLGNEEARFAANTVVERHAADVALETIKAKVTTSFADLAKPMREALARDGIAAMRRALDPEGKHSNAELDDLIARSSVGAGVRNIEQNGIEAETADLEAEADREVAIESMAAIRALIGAFITGPAKGSSYERLDRLIRKIIGIVAFGVPAPGADS